MRRRRKSDRHHAKLDVETVRLIRASKQSSRALGRIVGVSHEAIRQVRSRVTWKDV